MFHIATPEDFAHNVSVAKSVHKFGACVDAYAAITYRNMRCYLADDGTAGFTVKPDGDLVSVFSLPGSDTTAGDILATAVAYGATRLDCFDTVLPAIYAAHGFVEVARCSFDDDFAPEGWDFELFEQFNGGRPDVVFMVHESAADWNLQSMRKVRVANYAQGLERAEQITNL